MILIKSNFFRITWKCVANSSQLSVRRYKLLDYSVSEKWTREKRTISYFPKINHSQKLEKIVLFVLLLFYSCRSTRLIILDFQDIYFYTKTRSFGIRTGATCYCFYIEIQPLHSVLIRKWQKTVVPFLPARADNFPLKFYRNARPAGKIILAL